VLESNWTIRQKEYDIEVVALGNGEIRDFFL
jgi:hypothetical protein